MFMLYALLTTNQQKHSTPRNHNSSNPHVIRFDSWTRRYRKVLLFPFISCIHSPAITQQFYIFYICRRGKIRWKLARLTFSPWQSESNWVKFKHISRIIKGKNRQTMSEWKSIKITFLAFRQTLVSCHRDIGRWCWLDRNLSSTSALTSESHIFFVVISTWHKWTVWRMNYGKVYCNHQSYHHKVLFRCSWSDCNMASDAIQKRSNLLDIECSHRSARDWRVLHIGNQKESGMAMVSGSTTRIFELLMGIANTFASGIFQLNFMLLIWLFRNTNKFTNDWRFGPTTNSIELISIILCKQVDSKLDPMDK